MQWSDGIHSMGAPKWQLVVCLLAVYSMLYLSLFKGVKSSGKYKTKIKNSGIRPQNFFYRIFGTRFFFGGGGVFAKNKFVEPLIIFLGKFWLTRNYSMMIFPGSKYFWQIF